MYFQIPVRWATLQAVISPRPNPLLAEVRVKPHETQGNLFYCMDQSRWYSQVVDSAVYRQSSLRGCPYSYAKGSDQDIQVICLKFDQDIGKKVQ